MNETPQTSRREEWLEFWEDREIPFFKALPYPLLFLCVVFDVVLRHGIDRHALEDLAMAAAATVLMLTVDRLDRRYNWNDGETGIPAMRAGILFGALWCLAAGLVISQPIYGFYTWTGYFWAWRLLRGNLRFAGVVAVAGITALSQTGGHPYHSPSQVIGFAAVYLVNATIACGFTWFGWVGNEQRDRRARAVEGLTEANARLEETLRDNAQLHEQLLVQAREAGVADERQRMAREIHDTLAQGLTGIVTQLQAAQYAARQDADAPGARHIDAAIRLARESLAEARRSVNALAPEALEGTRLPDAVQQVARNWTELHGVPVAVTTTGTALAVGPDIEVALLRTAQEALANVAKHARAERVGLTLSYMDDLVTLDVRDDGVGFKARNGSRPPIGGDASGGFGLDVMRQRVEGVGGRLAIESEPGTGTAISAAVPLPSGRCP